MGQLSSCSSCCNKRDLLNQGIFIFHYGASNPESLSQKLGCDPQDIINRAIPCVLRDHVMVFGGKSKQWNGKSTATLLPQPKHSVRGFCILHNERELSILSTFEGYPLVHDRIDVMVTEVDKYSDNSKRGYATFKELGDNISHVTSADQSEYLPHEDTLPLKRQFMAQAFVRKTLKTFSYPDRIYLIECCKNTFTYMTLKGDDLKIVKEFVIEVRKSDNPSKIADQFHYPIIRSATNQQSDKILQSGGLGNINK